MNSKKCDPSKHLHLIDKPGGVHPTLGYVFVGSGRNCKFGKHRLILFAKIGPGEHPCHHCGKPVSWDASIHREPSRALVADHLDFNKLNNDPANLVPSCNLCNSTRGKNQQAATIEHGGETITVAELASRFGRSPHQLRARLRKGMTIGEVLSTPVQRITLTHNGLTLSAAEWARRTGLPFGAITARIHAGWTTEQALTLPTGSRVKRVRKPQPARIDTRKRLTFNGHTRTIGEWAKLTGLSYESINIRLRRGWTVERALTTGGMSRGHSINIAA